MTITNVYDRNAGSYDQSYDSGLSIDNRFIEWPAIKKLVKKTSGKKLLDIGCGSGRHLEHYQKMGFDCSGIDISSEMIKLAQQRNPTAKLTVGSMQKLPFSKNSFDVVTSSLAFHYGDFNRILKEVNRVLKPNGIIIFSTTNPYDDAREKITVGDYKVSAWGKVKNLKTGEQTFLGNYFETNQRSAYWKNKGFTVEWKHSTFQQIIQALAKNHFFIQEFIEAKPVKKAKKINPQRFEYTSKNPVIVLFKAKKLSEKYFD